MSSLEDRLKLLEPAPASDALRARIAFPGRTRSRKLRYIPLAAAAAGLIAAFIFAVREAPHGRTTSTTQAEADFKKIEETLMAANSLRIKVQRQLAMQKTSLWEEELIKGDLTLLLKQGNRVQIDQIEERMVGTPKVSKAYFRYTSNGKRMKMTVMIGDQEKKAGEETDTPADLHQRFILALARECVGVPNNILLLQQQSVASDVRPAAVGAPYKSLIYHVGNFEARLLYDPKSFLPIQRTLTSKDFGTITEIYSFEIDVPIDDREFILPEGK